MIRLLCLASLVRGEQRRIDQDDQKRLAQVYRPSLIISTVPAGCFLKGLSAALFTHNAVLHRCSSSPPKEKTFAWMNSLKTASKFV